MVAVLEDPAIRAQVVSYSVEQYHKFYDLGVLPNDCELIRGAIVKKMPQSAAHASAIESIRRCLEQFLLENTFVREEKPLTLTDSEPEPDLAVVRGNWQDFRDTHPTTALLIVEISITSEAVDRLKIELYAEAGVLEYWIAFPGRRTIERYRDPVDGVYLQTDHAVFPETLVSTAVARLRLPPDDLFVS